MRTVSIWSRILRRTFPMISWETSSAVVSSSVEELPAVQRCVGLIAGDVSRCPVVVRDTASAVVPDPSIEGLLGGQALGDSLTGRDLRRWMATEALLHGNAFAAIITDSQGAPVALRPLSSGGVSMREDADGTVRWYYQQQEVEYAQLLHWKGLASPSNPYWGQSPLMAAATTVEAIASLEASYLAFARTGSYGKLGFTHPGALNPAVRDAMRTAFVSQHLSSSAAGTPIFVGEGMKIEQLAPTWGRDVSDARAAGNRVVASVFGVPAAYLDSSDARTQPEVAQFYVSGCLEVFASSWEAEITSKLCTPGTRAAFDWSPVTQGDFRTAGRAYAKLVEVGVLAPNDVRARLGFEPYPGLDEPKPVISGVPNDMADPMP